MADLRADILARISTWESDHSTTGCPGGPRCIYAAAKALRAVVEFHSASTKRGREDICAGCDTVATFTWLDRCPTVSRIAEELGIEKRDG